MNAHTLDKLQFDNVRKLLARRASCALGKGLAESMRPADQVYRVRLWLDQTKEMLSAVKDRGYPPFGGMTDVRPLVRQSHDSGHLDSEQIGQISNALRAATGIKAWLEVLDPEAHPLLRRLAERCAEFGFLADNIDRVVDPRGGVHDHASSRLQEIRRKMAGAREQMRTHVGRLLADRHVVRLLQYPGHTFHGDRMVLPLRSDQRGRLPGIVHRTSDGGATLFVEPAESVSLNNQITEWKADEEHEVSRLLWELTHQIRKNTDSIVSSLNAAAVLDLISAKARYAEDEECHPAAISEDRQLHLLQARHPLLIETCRENGEAVVPIDVRLADDFDILVITGPNTGGKTVVLQTVGLLAIMHQAGMPIPAAPDSRIPIFKDIMVDIGDEQSIAQSLSTFSAHLRRIKEVIGRASPETLVLLDELGAGTDPDEGAALSQSILEELRIRAAPTVITTHLGALKGYAYQNPRVDNAAVEFDVETLRPTYHLQIGEPGASNALAIASRLGIPAELVERARGYQDHRLQELSEAIERTAERRREAEAARDDALQKARIMEARDSELQAELADLKAAQEEFSDWSRRISALRPGDEVFVKKFGKNGRVVRMSLHQQLAVVDLSEFQVEVPVGELA